MPRPSTCRGYQLETITLDRTPVKAPAYRAEETASRTPLAAGCNAPAKLLKAITRSRHVHAVNMSPPRAERESSPKRRDVTRRDITHCDVTHTSPLNRATKIASPNPHQQSTYSQHRWRGDSLPEINRNQTDLTRMPNDLGYKERLRPR